MTNVRITCPECSFSRELPAEKVPERPVRVTCPRCKGSFPFSRGDAKEDLPASSGELSPEHLPDRVDTSVPPGREDASPSPRPAPRHPGEKAPRTGAAPLPRSPSGRPDGGAGSRARTIRLVILLLLLATAIGYALLEKIPYRKIARLTTPARQVITIPPPSGQPPALPTGSVSVRVTAGDAPPAGAPALTSPTGARFEPYDFPVFIYAVNLIGKVRVNGQEFKEIKGDPDMQYNINTYGEPFRYGANSIELDLAPATGGNRSMNPELRLKVSRRDSRDERRVIGEWQFAGQSGWPRTVSLEIPEVKP